MTNISIILPVYNSEKDLSHCLNSVLEQTLSDFELICIDDGSTDGTPDILAEYAQQDRRIRIFKQEHKGAGAARNLGLEQASGKYIAFIDGDDLYPDKTTLEKLFTTAEDNGCDICGGSLLYLNKQGTETPVENDYIFTEKGFCDYNEYQYDYGYHRFIYRTDFIHKNKLYFPDYLRGQDPPFFVKAMIAAGRFYRLPDICYLYRLHEQQRPSPIPLQMYGKLSSFRDILQMSARHDLAKLHYLQAERLNNYVKSIKREFNNPQIKQIVGEIIDALDYRLLAKVNPNFKLNEFIKFIISPCKVSVIIPVYNVAPYLEKCLDSVINQSCREIEIICINDGSTDDSLKILQRYKEQDSRIIIIDQKNTGLSAARNNGLKKASAPYIAFIDSDDWIDPLYLEKLLLAMFSTNADSVVCSSLNLSERPELLCRTRQAQIWSASKRHNQTVMNRDVAVDYFIPNAWAKIYKKSLIDQYKLTFPEGLINEDEAWHWYYTNLSQKTACISDPLYRRLIRGDSIMGQKNFSPQITDILQIYSHIYRFLKKNGFWMRRKKEFYNRCQSFMKNIINVAAPELRHHAALEIVRFLVTTKLPEIPADIENFIRQNTSFMERRPLWQKNIKRKAKNILEKIVRFVGSFLLFPWYIYKIYKKL